MISPQPNSEKRIVQELVVLSWISLFLELLIIRWMSADIRAFTVFRTLPLITCFVGLGVGFALRKDDAYKMLLPAIVLFGFSIVLCNYTGVCFWGFPSVANFQWPSLVVSLAKSGWPYLIAFPLVVLLLLAGPFGICLAIGSRLGVLFNQLTPLKAYSYNVLGAVAGSITLPLLSFFGSPPWLILLVTAVILVLMQWPANSRRSNLVSVALVGVLVLLFLFRSEKSSQTLIPELVDTNTRRTVMWSPYQRIDLTTFSEKLDDKGKPTKTGFLGLEIGANRAFYQYFFSPHALHTSSLSNNELLKFIVKDYALAFALNKPKDVLVVGAGTGQNVSAALEAGLQNIDAVEIDPAILAIGREFNPDYHSEHVHLFCDDARHYFINCHKKYDVIEFSTLDSHTVAGLGSSVRVDTYIYTVESIRRALTLLNDDGLLVCSFMTIAPWTKERLYLTFKEAAGYEPLCLGGKMIGEIYILGRSVQNGSLATNPALSDYKIETPRGGGTQILTDDWPYLYVRTDVIDYPYLIVVTEIVLLSIFVARGFLMANRDLLNWQLFFLGAAFMLLELHAITFLSLLYGSTWITSAIAITAILLMILAANALVLKFEKVFSQPTLPYMLLFAALLMDYFLPAEQMVAYGITGHALATLVTMLPLAAAAIVFANAFKRAENISGALAFNLFGAVVGGLLEYLSSYTGIKSLVVVGFVLYLLSMLCALYRKAPGVPSAT